MLLSKVKRTLELNEQSIVREGIPFYYSKLKCRIALFLDIMILSGFIYILFIGYPMCLFSIFAIPYFIYKVLNVTLPKLLYKNPLFIVYKKTIFYSQEGWLLDLNKCEVLTYLRYLGEWIHTLYIKEKPEGPTIREHLWYIENVEELKSLLRKILKTDSISSWKSPDYPDNLDD